MGERRRESRLLCADMVEAEWKDRKHNLRITTALLEDISPLGVCLQLETEIPVGTIVLLDLPGAKTRAIVQYCIWREIGYFAGLTFSPGSRWSPKQFRPQHLTDPLRLNRSFSSETPIV